MSKTAGLPKKIFLYLPGTQLKQVFVFYTSIYQSNIRQPVMLPVYPQFADWKEEGTGATNRTIFSTIDNNQDLR